MRPFPGFDCLYELHDPIGKRAYRACFEHDSPFGLSRGETIVTRPVRVSWAMGSSVPGDVIWTVSAHPLIVSLRIVKLFRAAGLVGWKTYPVSVYDKQGKKTPGYAGLAIVGRCGRINLAESRIVLHRYPAGYFPHFLGHFFQPSSWDGSDFCTDRPDSHGNSSMRRIVTEDVVALLKRHRVSNLSWERLTEATVSTNVFETGLRYLLPTDFEFRVAAAYRAAGVRPPAARR